VAAMVEEAANRIESLVETIQRGESPERSSESQ
jgi:hypothetical protein